MQGVRVSPDHPETLELAFFPDPRPGPGEVLIDVRAAGLNRADVLQRRGSGNMPLGASDVLGLEVSGTVSALGPGSAGFAVGDKVVALLDSGGYATKAVAPSAQVLPIPDGVDLLDAAGIPEVAATLVSNVLIVARFEAGETVLIHGATGGIGTFGIQFVKAMGGRVAVTASSQDKLEVARQLGAEVLINYRDQDFAEAMEAAGGADIIIDTVGGPYLTGNLRALAPFGRVITIGKQGGPEGPLDFTVLMKKKASVIGTLLRDRSTDQKAEIIKRTHDAVWPLYRSGLIVPMIDRTFPLSDAAAAHEYFDSSEYVGKVLLDCHI